MDPRTWLAELQPRERRLIAVAAVLLICLLFYLLAWRPLQQRVAHLDSRLTQARKDLVWMQQASREVQALRRQGGAAPAPATGLSLIRAVESSVTAAGLRGSLTRTEPHGADRISLELRDADFDALVRWLGILQRQHGARVTQINVTRTDKPGRVNARLTLSRSS